MRSKNYPHCLDVFGGHYQPVDAPDPRNCALRESAEEITFVKGGSRVQLDSDWLVPLSNPFEMESMESHNRGNGRRFSASRSPVEFRSKLRATKRIPVGGFVVLWR